MIVIDRNEKGEYYYLRITAHPTRLRKGVIYHHPYVPAFIEKENTSRGGMKYMVTKMRHFPNSLKKKRRFR